MGQYAGITATAAALLARKGAVVTLRQATAGTYDPVTQVDATATTVDTSVHAVLLPVGDSRRFSPGELIRRHMMEAWMAAQNITVTPQPGNQLIFGSTTWNIVSVTEYAPDGGSPIAWRAYVER